MPSHDYHDALPGYDPRQLLVDGCEECEARSKDVALTISLLDSQRFERAWRRAFDGEASQGDSSAVGPVSAAERPLLATLWATQIQFERLGIPLTGTVPGRDS